MKKNNMKKTGRIVRSCFAAALAVILAVPVASLSNLGSAPVNEPVEVQAADVDLPDPIMTLDFERGFKGEAEKNGLKVKESKERLMYEEVRGENDEYIKDENGEYIYEWTETPVIYGTGDSLYYQKGTFGNQPATYDDPEKGNTIRLDDSMEAEWIIKTESDKADNIVPVYTGEFDEEGNPTDLEAAKESTLQIAHTAHSAVQINNPFVNLDFTETPEEDEELGPQWTKGVTISYWVKVPTVEPAEGEEVDEDEILNDSVLFTFENLQRPEDVDQYTLDPNGEKVTYEVNGYIKYLAASNYDPEDPMYAQGELSTLTDFYTKEEFQVLSDYGPLVRLTPGYPGTAENKIYFRDDEWDKTPDKEVSVLNTKTGKIEKAKLHELGANIYNDYRTLDTTEGSLVPRGYINGSMQIAASNTFHFKEDDYYEQVTLDENGNEIRTPVKGAYDINPNNKEEIGKFRQLRHYNLYYFEGDGTVNETPDVWHYVTCVIQNDWVQFYVDGEEIEPDALGYHGTDFNSLNGKKYFNNGFGIRYPYHIGWTNVAEWIDNGTLNAGPSNCQAQTILEWISNPDTLLYIGYEGICAENTDQQIGTLDGTLLDDITFYDVPLTYEQATALYDKAVAEKDAVDDLTPIKVWDFESTEIDALPEGMTALETNTEDTRTPKVVNDEDYGKVFKFGEGKSRKTSAVSFENPFKGKTDIEGATISYWVKTYANEKGKVGDGVVLSFIDEPKVLEHGKIQEAYKEVESRTGLWSWLSCDAEFHGGFDTQVYDSLKNKYTTTTKKNGNTDPDKVGYDEESAQLEKEWNERVNSLVEWQYVTMVLENSGITMYLNGVKHDNNQENEQGPTFYGPRFYDGYYNKVLDTFSKYRVGTGNQTATSLMEFLTQEDTSLYLGFVYALGSNATYRASALTLVDDVAFYDKALSEEEVATIYADAVSASESKKAEAGDVYDPYPEVEATPVPTEDGGDDPVGATDAPGSTDAPVPTNAPVDDKQEVTVNKTEDGKFTATANGVTVTGNSDSIPEGAKLVVNKLGEESSKANYEAAEKALKAAGIAIDTFSRVIYDIHFEVDGKVVSPTESISITITPPTGYDASKLSIVRVSDVASMKTTVVGTTVQYDADSLGEFVIMQKKPTTGQNPVQNGNNATSSGSKPGDKTGDSTSIAVPVVLLVVALVVIVALRKKEELMED